MNECNARIAADLTYNRRKPEQSPVINQSLAVNPVPTRRRGKGSRTQAAPTVSESSQATSGKSKRGRGRPKKSTTT